MPLRKSWHSNTAGADHIIACNAAAAMANRIRTIQINPRQSFSGGSLESSDGCGAGCRKPIMRE